MDRHEHARGHDGPRAKAHDHAHGHGHGHSHQHASAAGGARRALIVALVLTGGFAVVEAVGGWIAGSLALLSDAGHMITDAAALGLALFANAIARRPVSSRASYGYGRAEVLAAFVNAIAMLAVVALIAIEAVKRLLDPVPVAGGLVTAIAFVGLAVNIAAAWVLSRETGSLNTRGALLHVMGDLLGSLAAIVAGGVILATGWMPIDPILSLAVALLILRSTWQLLKQSTGVLMEGVPGHLDFDAIGRSLAALPGVSDVHDLHIWNTSSDGVALSAHLSIARGEDWPALLAHARRVLATDYGIRHATLQPTWPVDGSPRGDRRVIPMRAADE
ncbi:MAG: cation diffusion facilitator family transporter [Burkholderiales bacterium]